MSNLAMGRSAPADLEKQLAALVSELLPDVPVSRVTAEAREDSTGSEAIFLDVVLASKERRPTPEKTSELSRKVQSLLAEAGDNRFAYVRIAYPERPSKQTKSAQ
jgi:hypothetical protein